MPALREDLRGILATMEAGFVGSAPDWWTETA